MYKTEVYTLVNSVIAHQKQQRSKFQKSDIAHWHLGIVMLRNITFFIFAVFDV